MVRDLQIGRVALGDQAVGGIVLKVGGFVLVVGLLENRDRNHIFYP